MGDIRPHKTNVHHGIDAERVEVKGPKAMLESVADTDATDTVEAQPKKRKKPDVPVSKRMAFGIDEAAAVGGYSRAWLWSLVSDGIIEVRRFRGRTWIDAETFREFIRNPPKA